jgi:hypothetical protein
MGMDPLSQRVHPLQRIRVVKGGDGATNLGREVLPGIVVRP